MSINPPEDHEHGDEPNIMRYFLPNQAVLHLDHTPGLDPVTLVNAFNGFLEQQSNEPPWNYLDALPGTGRVSTFSGDDSAYSIIPSPFKLPMDVEGIDEYEKTANIILQLYNQLGDSPREINSDLRINLWSAAPNWLMGASSHQIGIGGPGNWPEAAPAANGREHSFGSTITELRDKLQANQGAGVHVAILDSAPCLHELAEAYEYWHEHHHDEHKLLEKLLEPGGPLSVHPATYDDLLSLADYSAAGHRYAMTDHGLFIAGIIHTIAPQAKLHLYEVLNPYGMGSIETIARGIFNALSDKKDDCPLVINCSFMLGGASGNDFDPDVKIFDPPPAGLYDYLTMTARTLFETLTTPGGVKKNEKDDVIVVAASGNDAKSVPPRPPARYPAAYPNVFGVGALTKPDPSPGTKDFASYSNQADDPPNSGYLTLGGEKGAGIEGVYIGRLPVNLSGLPDGDHQIRPEDVGYVPNFERGWARWSGTSFAAPIISGLLAVWWSNNNGGTPTDARNFLNGFAASPLVAAAARLSGQGTIIPVEQA